MNGEPGVVSASIQMDLDLPPSPEGLLRLSDAFGKVGYTKLSRYLRACADALSGKGSPPRDEVGQNRLSLMGPIASALLPPSVEDRL